MGKYDSFANEFIKLYNDGISVREIGRRYDISKGTVSSILKKHITLRPKISANIDYDGVFELYQKGYTLDAIRKKYHTSPETIKKILTNQYGIEFGFAENSKYVELANHFKNDYIKGLSLSEIAANYNVSAQTVLNYLNTLKVDVRNYEESGFDFDINDTYFDSIDSNEKAYVLGCLYANGSFIYTNYSKKILKITLPEKNISSIMNCINKFSSKGFEQLESMDKTNGKILRIYSSKIVESITKLGLIKSLPLDNLETDYVNTFLQAFFDFNLSITKKQLNIICREEYIQDLYEYISINLGFNLRKNKTYLVLQNTDDIIKFLDLYPNLIERINEYHIQNPELTKWKNLLYKYYEIVNN